MSDALLASTDVQEALSRAYVQAVSAAAGYTVATADFDRDGIDVTIGAGGLARPKIDAQLKATVNLQKGTRDTYRYVCPVRNYNLLRLETQTPRIIVVLDLPKESAQWVSISVDELILRHCAYWACLTGASETRNEDSITISLPVANRLDVEGLRDLMQQSRSGRIST